MWNRVAGHETEGAGVCLQTCVLRSRMSALCIFLFHGRCFFPLAARGRAVRCVWDPATHTHTRRPRAGAGLSAVSCPGDPLLCGEWVIVVVLCAHNAASTILDQHTDLTTHQRYSTVQARGGAALAPLGDRIDASCTRERGRVTVGLVRARRATPSHITAARVSRNSAPCRSR